MLELKRRIKKTEEVRERDGVRRRRREGEGRAAATGGHQPEL